MRALQHNIKQAPPPLHLTFLNSRDKEEWEDLHVINKDDLEDDEKINTL